ncbi:bacterioferritin-associated ferredoxin [Atopomonas sediminilitoris]|uniref:bacterioferritin-associated ferredoxin n=1 Tax=Atopomonas sediminilitoris TaxID=2919919 RepID=UPI001F4DF20A|nr:bacterioferritin-associated ferredoxin [Atopomonas sediminilitoris]MCJ8169809.1 bacterioferritin-associated ferredoxin [Atopomonas sediminilitoris]
MYVCLCQGVTDHQLRAAVDSGCGSYKEVRLKTGVASQCGKCACQAKQIVRDALADMTFDFSLAYPAEGVAA